MKIYRIPLILRTFITLFWLLLTIAALVDIISRQRSTSLVVQIAALTLTIVGPLAIYFFNTKGAAIDAEKVEVLPPGRHRQCLHWDEVETVTIAFGGETGSLQLFPKPASGKKSLYISLSGMPLEMVRDVIRHVPPQTKVVLDERMQRKLAGRQVVVYRREGLYETTAADWIEFWAGRKAAPTRTVT